MAPLAGWTVCWAGDRAAAKCRGAVALTKSTPRRMTEYYWFCFSLWSAYHEQLGAAGLRLSRYLLNHRTEGLRPAFIDTPTATASVTANREVARRAAPAQREPRCGFANC